MSSMSESEPGQPQFRIQLIDMAALVVGYGLAAVLFRAFWPQSHVPPALGCFAVGFYVWLGLAMSGPLILLRHRHAGPLDPGGIPPAQPNTSTGRTWAEMAWLLIGIYWIVMGVFILPIRLHSFKFSDTILFGLVPLAAGLVLRVFGPRIRPRDRDHVFWTHQVAVGLLVTWPIAWVCLIVVAEAML
jgi:FtsH-binding integral membrane protein